jgi:hypothetical protein
MVGRKTRRGIGFFSLYRIFASVLSRSQREFLSNAFSEARIRRAADEGLLETVEPWSPRLKTGAFGPVSKTGRGAPSFLPYHDGPSHASRRPPITNH